MTDILDTLRQRLRSYRADDEDGNDEDGSTAEAVPRAGIRSSPSSPDPEDGIVATLVPDLVRTNFLVKILVGMVGIIILSALIGGYFYTGINGTLNDQIDRQVRSTTALHENVYSNWFADRREEVNSVAGRDVFTTGDPEEISRELDTARSTSDSIQHFHFVDSQTGEVIASSNDAAVGQNMFNRSFNRTQAQQTSFFYDQRYTSFSGTPAIAFVQNVPYVEGVLVAQINPESAGPEIEQTIRGANTTLVSRDGDRLIGNESVGSIDANLSAGNVTVTQTGDEIIAYEPLGSNSNLVVVTQTPKRVAFGVRNEVLRSFGVTLVLTFLVLVSVTLVGGRSVIRDLNVLVTKAQAMGSGDLDVDLETRRDDEIGVLYDEFDEMRQALDEQISEAESALEEARQARTDAEDARSEAESAKAEAEQLNAHLESKADEYSDVMQACAAGDFTRRMDPDSESEAMAEIAEEFNNMIDQIEAVLDQVKTFADEVADASTEVASGADEVKSASEEVSESTQDISEGANEQSQSLQEINAEMSNLSASIQQAASSSSEVAATADTAVERGEEGREAARAAIEEINRVEDRTDQTVEQMETLGEKMEEVGEIVEFITDIAEQTNMLALNANIEAARAGEAGSGFAVVADEVKSLAEETQEAAAEIETVIQDIQQYTDQTVEEMRDTSETVTRGVTTVEDALDALEEIVERIEETNRGIQEINQAADDQAASTERVVARIDEITEISNQMSQQAEDVAAASEEQTASVTEIAQSADDLRTRSGTLRDKLNTFTVHADAAARMTGDSQPASTDGGDGPSPDDDIPGADLDES